MGHLNNAGQSRRAIILGLGGALAVPPGTAFAQSRNGADIMRASHETTRFSGARFSARLILQTGTSPPRTRTLKGVSKTIDGGVGNARRMDFLSPAEMRGVSTLTVERGSGPDDLWIYLPSLRRVRRLVSSNRRDPWVGSDFSLGDILGHDVGDWTHTVDGVEDTPGGKTTRITSLPSNPQVSRDTGYSKRVSWIRSTDSALVRAEFYDLAGKRIKLLTADDFRVIDRDKIQPMRLVMRSVSGGSTSILSFDEFKIDRGVKDADVAAQALQS